MQQNPRTWSKDKQVRHASWTITTQYMFRVCLPRLRALNPSRARLASTTPTPSGLPAAPQYLKVTRRFHRMLESKRPLQLSDGPLVWIDCEMTGLDHRRDKIIEIAVRIILSITVISCERPFLGHHYERKSGAS